MNRRPVALLALTLAHCVSSTAAVAGTTEVSMGVGVGFAADLADRASDGNTRLGVGPRLWVPLRITPVPYLRVRVDLGFNQATGLDQLTWTRAVAGGFQRVTDDDEHTAWIGTGSLTAGVDAVVPVEGRVQPHLGVSAGGALIAAFHAMRGTSLVLLDPAVNDLGNSGNLDPYTLQVVPLVGVQIGLVVRLSERVDLWFETGYESAFVGPVPLVKAPVDLDARREAFAWNPIHGAIGIWARL